MTKKKISRLAIATLMIACMTFASLSFVLNNNAVADAAEAETERTVNVQTASARTYPSSFRLNKWVQVCAQLPCEHMANKVFNSLDEAAIDWGKTYNPKAQVTRKEYGSTIFQIAVGKYAYALPEIGTVNSVFPNEGCLRLERGDAVIHSHPMGVISLGAEEKLSGGDWSYGAGWTDYAYEGQDVYFDIWVYVTTPEGKLKKVLPDKGYKYYEGFWFNQFGYLFANNITVSSSIPHDKRANGQVFKFKHWFNKKCNDCAQKLA